MMIDQDCIITKGNVVLVDPNCANINNELVNGIAQYQDMHIYADLTATRRGRTVIQKNVGITTDETITVNMMGFNQDEGSKNHGLFTTNYYDGSTGNRTQYESFGIESINIKINSSFIPQVNIKFVDLRGLSFFNDQPDGKDSPYRILFDFPPPIFRLTIKGYYGKAIKYDLHLVKYTSDFKSDSGNFHIDAHFVALTFAPLADILFRYVVNFPLMMDNQGIVVGGQEPPKNTFDLITKVKSLLNAETNLRNTDTDVEFYDDTINNEQRYQTVLNFLANSVNSTTLNEIDKQINFFIEDSGENEDDFTTDVNHSKYRVIDNIQEFNQILVDEGRRGVSNDSRARLYVGCVIENDSDESVDNITITTLNQLSTSFNRRLQTIINILNRFRTDTITFANNNIANKTEVYFENLLKKAMLLPDKFGLDGYNDENTYFYLVLDLTEIYTTIYNSLNNIRDDKSGVISRLNTKISNMISSELGMLPTIYNIFKIILDDVDKMFYLMRKTSIEAFQHHNDLEIKPLIINNTFYRDVGMNNMSFGDIYSYPLVIDKVNRDGVTTEQRVAPIKLSQGLGSNRVFPELILIQDFIDTFKYQNNITRQLNFKLTQNPDGTYVWIPIAPFDSKLSSLNVNTPYLGIDTVGGTNEATPKKTTGADPAIIEIMKIAITRFYILTQFVLPKTYENSVTGNNDRSKALIDLFAKSEALNISSSIRNELLRSNIKDFAGRYNIDNVENFNTYLRNNLNQLYTLTPNETDGTDVEFRDYLFSNKNIYVNKNNPNYKGCSLILPRSFSVTRAIDRIGDIKNTDPNFPIHKYREEIAEGFWEKLVFWKDGAPSENFGYLEENLFFISDGGENSRVTFETRYVGGLNDFQPRVNNTLNDSRHENYSDNRFSLPPTDRRRSLYKDMLINDILSIDSNTNLYGGNSTLLKNARNFLISNNHNLSRFNNIVNTWSETLGFVSNVDEANMPNILKIKNDVNENDRLFSAIILLSNFGYTLSPFNKYRNNFNNTVFSTPSVVELPRFVSAYIGALVDIEIPNDLNNIDNSTIFGRLYNFFVGGNGKNLPSGGFYIFADIVDIKNYLSEQDKRVFRQAYNDFSNRHLNQLLENYGSFVQAFENRVDEENIDLTIKRGTKTTKFTNEYMTILNELLDPNNGSFFGTVLQPLLEKNYLLINSEITFKRKDLSPTAYNPMSNLGNSYADYFNVFFNELKNSLGDIEQDEKDREIELRRISDDEDIINQTYYSFKNINDKWLTSPTHNNTGYTFNDVTRGDALINLFAFVDRAMNPAGDTIINPEILVDLMDDPNVTLYGVLSQLLSSNGFEFFPLQNFMNIETEGGWEKSFKIDTSGTVNNSPNFVCMYIGGSSSYVTGINRMNNFLDDGIVNIVGPGLSDFSKQQSIEPAVPERDNQKATNRDFPWGEVRAFRVRFAQQNQSMFKNVEVNSKEFPETNESIQILSRIAGDNRANAPIPKGQNLYNLYENRAYSATVSGLGNAMLQPTQYFQLENVPLYNGAYLILDVEHDITPNKMDTKFTGTKILKYPTPRVTNPASIFGFDEGSTESSNAGMASTNSITLGGGTNVNPDESRFNSMYEQKIEE